MGWRLGIQDVEARGICMCVGMGMEVLDSTLVVFSKVERLGKMSKFISCSPHIQQPTAANLYRKNLHKSAAFWVQPAVMNCNVFPY